MGHWESRKSASFKLHVVCSACVSDHWNTADKQAEVEDEEDAPAPKATKAKADKAKKPAAKVEAAPADDGTYSTLAFAQELMDRSQFVRPRMCQGQGLASQAPEGFPRKGPSYRRCKRPYIDGI